MIIVTRTRAVIFLLGIEAKAGKTELYVLIIYLLIRIIEIYAYNYILISN